MKVAPALFVLGFVACVAGCFAAHAQISLEVEGANVLTSAAGLIDGSKVQSQTIGSAQLATGAVGRTALAAGAVGNAAIASNAVTGAKISDSTITSTDILNGTITGTDVQDASIASADLATSAVSSTKIADAAVTPAKLDSTLTYSVSKLGINTSTVPHDGIGYAKLALDGPDMDLNCASAQWTSYADNYPVLNIMTSRHDSMAMRFDAYYGLDEGSGMQRSSDAGSNMCILKHNDHFYLQYQHDLPSVLPSIG